MTGTTEETPYEKSQKFNAVVDWLHTYRYVNIRSVFRELATRIGDRPIKVVDIGCAHAKVYQVLDRDFDIEYTGIEPLQPYVDIATQRYGGRGNFRVFCTIAQEAREILHGADIIVALETLEHIPEDIVVKVVDAMAEARPAMLVVSVPVEIGPALWLKNVGSLLCGYARHREYTWRETFWAGLYQLDRLPRHTIHHTGFDWRWLAQTIRYRFRIREIRRSPFRYLPTALAFSVFIVADSDPPR